MNRQQRLNKIKQLSRGTKTKGINYKQLINYGRKY